MSSGASACSQCGQADRVAAMILSGCSASARVTPGRLGRGGFLPGSGRFGFWPFDGGAMDLPGVFGGAASLGFKIGDTRGQQPDLLRLDQGDQVIAGEGNEGGAVHAWSRFDSAVTVSRHVPQAVVSNYRLFASELTRTQWREH